MTKKKGIKAPSRKLPFLMVLMIFGFVLGGSLMSLEIIIKYYYVKPHWIWTILGHIGTGTIVATIVGIGIDRLFYHEHLDALAVSISNRLAEYDKHITDLIPQTLSHMAAGRTLKYIKDTKSIYALISSKLEEYPYFTNTIINQEIGVPSTYRKEYYQHKVDLVNKGRLACRELVTPNAIKLVKEQLNQLNKEKRDNFKVKVVKLSPSLTTFINFCIFQRNFEDFDDTFLMIGWFADIQSLYHRHTCIATDHPDLIRMFASYFEILERSAKPYVIK